MGASSRRKSHAVIKPERLQLLASLESVASVVLPRGKRRTDDQIAADYMQALASDVSIWEWNRYLMTDGSVYGGLYENYLYERIRQVPIVQVAKFLLLVPPLLFEQNTITQLGFIALCETLFAVYMIVAAPYSNAWMVIISHLTSIHHFLLVMLQCIFVIKEPDVNLAFEVGGAMLGISSTFFVLLFLFSALAFATPVILQKLRERGKKESHDEFFGKTEGDVDSEDAPLLLDPVDGIVVMRIDETIDAHAELKKQMQEKEKNLSALSDFHARPGTSTRRASANAETLQLESFSLKQATGVAAAGDSGAAAASAGGKSTTSVKPASTAAPASTKPAAATGGTRSGSTAATSTGRSGAAAGATGTRGAAAGAKGAAAAKPTSRRQ